VGYQIYRRVDDSELAFRIRTAGEVPEGDGAVSARIGTDAVRALGDRTFVVGGEHGAADFPSGTWEAVGAIYAAQRDTYDALVPTIGDSTSTGIDWSVYLVTVHTDDPEIWFASPPDSGYSVDNIAPNVPGGFVAMSQGENGNQLDWNDPVDHDFQYFNVYRATDPGFEHGPENLVHSTTASSWIDPSPGEGSAYYKLTAFDYTGNESDAAEASVTVGVGTPKLPARFALHPVAPNPVQQTARLRYDVPASGGEVRLEIFDVAGRTVRRLVDGTAIPGEQSAVWDGRDHAGRPVPAGVYLCRMRAPEYMKVQRVLLAQ
jgi:hypothetical protein